MKHPIKYEISIAFAGGEITKKDLLKLHDFTGLPLDTLKDTIASKRLVLGTIVNEQFYSGVKEIMGLINSLESTYKLFSNSSSVNKSFIEGIVYRVNNISLSDIR